MCFAEFFEDVSDSSTVAREKHAVDVSLVGALVTGNFKLIRGAFGCIGKVYVDPAIGDVASRRSGACTVGDSAM